jgi:hypothetical protein
MFNAFDHTYLFTPDVFLGTLPFGRILAAGIARDIQGGLKIYW